MVRELKQRWLNYSARERYLLSGSLLLLLLASCWYFVLSPLFTYHDKQQKAALQAAKEWQWLQDNQHKIVTLQARQPEEKTEQASLEDVILKSSQQQKIVLTTIRPTGAKIDVVIETVEFNRLLSWLQQLKVQYGIQAHHVKLIENMPRNGQVKVGTLQLSRSAIEG